jgi:uncharacterized protein (TIGR02246 family)
MRARFFLAGLAIGVVVLAARSADPQSETKKQTKQAADQKKSEPAVTQKKPATGDTKQAAKQPADRSADEQAIRANVALFLKAYNDGDAKTVASLFAPDGQVITQDGETVEGREAIEQEFNDIFAETPEARMELSVDSIRFIGSDLAVEVGSTKDIPAPGETPEYGRYTVLHVKRDGKWLMAAARDTEGEQPTNHERLLPLAFLLGEWIDDGGSAVVRTVCHWSDDKNFLLQEMNLQIAGKDAMQVTQRIGWDPLSKRIRSWVFDTEGGFGEGVWARDGDSWIIKSTGVRPDGVAASATNVIVPVAKDGYVWRVSDRVIGDEVEPALEVKVVRKPPAPGRDNDF